MRIKRSATELTPHCEIGGRRWDRTITFGFSVRSTHQVYDPPDKWLPVRVTLPVGFETRDLQSLLALYETTWHLEIGCEGWNCTSGVSNVAGLQPAAFAAQRHLPVEIGRLSWTRTSNILRVKQTI